MIEQCEKCALYNSLGCPYNLEIAEKIPDCDEYRPNVEAKITDPVKKQLFKLLEDSPSLVVLYDEQWLESVDYLVSNGVTIKSEIVREVLSDLKKQIHDRAVYPHAADTYSFVNLKVFDSVLQNILNKYTKGGAD